jgi:predicted transcriptional regulator
MRVLCAWCLKAGKSEREALIGEKEPVTDESASHGICPPHRQEVEDAVARLREVAERQQKDAKQQQEVAERQQEVAERQQKDAETLRRHVDP